MPPAARTASIARLRGLRPFERSQFFLDQRRRGTFAARLDAREQIALQAVFVGDEPLEVGIVRIGLGHQVEQVEGAAGCRGQVGRDRRDDAAGRAGDHENAVLGRASARVVRRRRLLFETDGPALVAGVSDLDGTGIAQRLVDQEVSDFRGLRLGSKSTALTSASGRSRL